MSSTRIIYFMYEHYKHCALSREPSISSSMTSSDSFTLFPSLPSELRLKIWQEVAAQPRTVELTCTTTSSNLPEGRWFSHTKPPHIFQVCSESREVALAQYSVIEITPVQIGLPCKTTLYINFSVDTLWLCSDLQKPWARDLLERNEQLRERLRYLAVQREMWKELNEVELTPAWTGYTGSAEPFPIPVSRGLGALVDLKFHS